MTGLFEGADNGRAPETRDLKPNASGFPWVCRGCGRKLKGGEFVRAVIVCECRVNAGYAAIDNSRQGVFCRACLATDYKVLDTVAAMLGPRTYR
jgi:hypothetical protein